MKPKQSMEELLKELDAKFMLDAHRQAKLMDWFAECAELVRNPGETDEHLAHRIKERVARDAVVKALTE